MRQSRLYTCQGQRFEYAFKLEIRLLIRLSSRILLCRATAHGWPALISHRKSSKIHRFNQPKSFGNPIVGCDLRSRLVIGKGTLQAGATQCPGEQPHAGGEEGESKKRKNANLG